MQMRAADEAINALDLAPLDAEEAAVVAGPAAIN